VHVSCDDPEAVFAQVFKSGQGSGRWIDREEFETEGGYRQRLLSAGISGKEVTFFISPDLCMVFPYPDKGVAFVVTQDMFSPTMFHHGVSNELTRAITVSLQRVSEWQTPMQNAFGVTVETSHSAFRRRMVRPDDFEHLPIAIGSPLRIGLPVPTTDPELRALLKEGKVGLAIRGRIGDIARSGTTIRAVAPTLDSPIGVLDTIEILPFIIQEASSIDVRDMTTIARWKRQ
jgi:hypothetical protein